MKIALLGYGKMGKLIEQLALNQGHTIIAKFSKGHPFHASPHLEQADVVIDFSQPECVIPHIKTCIQLKKNIVIGTTGWETQESLARQLVQQSTIGCLYAPNFSIGVHLFRQIVTKAARLITQFDEYDIGAVEYHHRQKADSPSGTAKALTQQILQEMDLPHGLQFSSVRCGHIPGTHTILFDGPADTITLTHQARNREGFAHGTLKAAEWIQGKSGFFSLEDMLESISLD